MEAVVAGWMAGYAMAILWTAALTYIAVRANDPGPFLRAMFPEGTSLILVAVPASVALFLGWTMLGLALASIYRLADLEDTANALGSPSLPFLLGVVAIAIMPLPLLTLFWRRHWLIWCAQAAAFVGLFGWAMPLLAGG